MAGLSTVTVDLEGGEVVLAGRRIALMPDDHPGPATTAGAPPARFRLADGAVVRLLAFGERSRLVKDALADDAPGPSLLRLLRAAAHEGPGSTLADAVLLAINGAAESAPAFDRCAVEASRARSWSWLSLRDTPAILVDRAVAWADQPDSSGEWQRFIFPGADPREVDDLLEAMVASLLARGVAGDGQPRSLLEPAPQPVPGQPAVHPSAPASSRPAATGHAPAYPEAGSDTRPFAPRGVASPTARPALPAPSPARVADLEWPPATAARPAAPGSPAPASSARRPMPTPASPVAPHAAVTPLRLHSTSISPLPASAAAGPLRNTRTELVPSMAVGAAAPTRPRSRAAAAATASTVAPSVRQEAAMPATGPALPPLALQPRASDSPERAARAWATTSSDSADVRAVGRAAGAAAGDAVADAVADVARALAAECDLRGLDA